VVIWFVPLLKTKKTEPLWCMPDPEPGINQCEAILHITPGGDLDDPAEQARPTATATAVPQPTTPVTPVPTPTPRPVQGDSVEDIILNSGCASCHQIGPLGEAHKVAPDLSSIGLIAGERVPGNVGRGVFVRIDRRSQCVYRRGMSERSLHRQHHAQGLQRND
jgi:hypothetical protein